MKDLLFTRLEINITSLFFLLVISIPLYGQKIITGRVIDENLVAIPGINIYSDSILIGHTDIDGHYELKLPRGSNKLDYVCVGYERVSIEFQNDCTNIEVILISDGTYNYKSNRKIDRLRRKRFDNLKELQLTASKKGLFVEGLPCYSRKFELYKQSLDEISKWAKKVKKRIKKDFKESAIGDTIQIPFSGSFRYDGTDRTTLFVWSSYTDANYFDCIIEGKILDKNRRRRGYNLTYKVINCEKCKYKSMVYEGKEMKTGEIFKQNMKYFKMVFD